MAASLFFGRYAFRSWPPPVYKNVVIFLAYTDLRILAVRKKKLQVDLVFHDCDEKLGKSFDEVLVAKKIRPRRLGPRSPNLNAFVESWIQPIKVECLDHFIMLDEAHLNYLVSNASGPTAHRGMSRPGEK